MVKTVTDLSAWREQALEALGADDGFRFQLQPGGEVFKVPHPLLLSDEQSGDLDRASGALAIATTLLGGPDRYGRFVASGGRAGDVMMAWRVMQAGVNVDPNSSAFTGWSDGAPQPSNPTSSTTTPANVAPSINGGAPSSPTPVS